MSRNPNTPGDSPEPDDSKEEKTGKGKGVTLSSLGLGRSRKVFTDSILLGEEIALVDKIRPRHRGDCADERGNPREEMRPCPFVSCSQHLYLDVNPTTGSIKLNFPDIPADEMHLMAETCALDVAGRGNITLEEVGALMNLTRERVRQIEVDAYEDMRLDIGKGYDEASSRVEAEIAERLHAAIKKEARVRANIVTVPTIEIAQSTENTTIVTTDAVAVSKGDDDDMDMDFGLGDD
ncbi:MAG: hypothetical protein NTX63_00825 [Candidatus Peregrinibacteria bacterium]|nr:hypothetical protein [Candidatus Peregrinibacteria bacterium]